MQPKRQAVRRSKRKATVRTIAPEGMTSNQRVDEILGIAWEDKTCRNLLDLLPELIYVKDRKGRYVISNLEHLKYLGFADPSYVVGKTVFELFPEELARQYHADDMHVMETGQEIVEQIEPSVGGNGEKRMVMRTKRPLRDGKGRIVGLVGTARDVTDRIREQEELEKKIAERTASAAHRSKELEQLKSAIDQSAVVVTTDTRGRITEANQKFCQLSGFHRSELIGQHYHTMSAGLHDAEHLRQICMVLAQGRAWHGQICGRAKDGSLFWLDTTIVPAMECKGEPKIAGYAFIGQDITEHRAAEEALRQRTKELEFAVEASESLNRELLFQKFALDQHAIVAVTDARGRITYVNDKFCQISKYTREELIGQDHSIVNSRLHSKEFFKEMYATIASGHVWHGEIRNRAKDGSLYWVDTTIVPIRDEKTGKNKGYVAIRADITALKNMQEHLQHAKEAAEAASQAKGEFLANMSHEIRTPMTAIIGYADLLADADRPVAERMDFVETIRRNGEHLLTIINDLLDLSKVDAGKLSLETIACSPARILKEVGSAMKGRAANKGIDFLLRMDPSIPPQIYSDPTRLRQVLLNLVSNAIKFTDSGSVRLTGRWDASRQMMRFDVSDTGIGLTPEQQNSIFKPFAQADTSTTRRYGGTGLGLALSRRLVELLGGELTMISEHGKGSTFSFTMAAPIAEGIDEAQADSDSRNNRLLARPTEPARLRGRLLLVEDGADNRRLVTIYLQDAGLVVEYAEDGSQAVEMVAQAQASGHMYDVILMDMQMPVMDGYEATAELRRRGVTDIPIIAFTAHALEGERDKCIAAGCNDYATKPVNPDRLIQTIAEQLKRSGRPKRRYLRPKSTRRIRKLESEQPSPEASIAPSSPMQITPVAESDASVIRSVYADNAAVKRVLPSYLADLPNHVAQMSLLLAQNRLTDLRRLVHQLRGSGGGYGFPDITRVATEAEATLDANAPLTEIETRVSDLCHLIRRVEGYDVEHEKMGTVIAKAA